MTAAPRRRKAMVCTCTRSVSVWGGGGGGARQHDPRPRITSEPTASGRHSTAHCRDGRRHGADAGPRRSFLVLPWGLF